MVKKIIPLFLIIILSLPIIIPFLQPGFFPMHDNTQPSRVYEMARALGDGQFPVRWVEDLGYGYGYPIFNFYSPLPYYFGAVWVLLGVDVLIATKVMFAAGVFLAGICMYLLLEKLFGAKAGLLGTILYVYAPYHAVEIFVRGAVGEYWAYGFVPLTLLGILKYKKHKILGIVIGALGFAGVILSHNITALVFGYLLGMWFFIECVRSIFKRKLTIHAQSLLASVLLGFGLAAFFFLPAVFESDGTKIATLTEGTNDYHTHFVLLDQLWNSPWGYAGSAADRADGMSFIIGKVHLLTLMFGSVGVAFLVLIKRKSLPGRLLLIGGGFGLCLFMLLNISTAVWEVVPLLSFVQYPWRLLLFVMLFLSLFAAGSLEYVFRKNPRLLMGFVGIMVVLIIVINYKYFRPQYQTAQTADDYIAESQLKFAISKISDEYLPKYFTIPQNLAEVAQTPFSYSDDIIVESSEVRSHRIHAVVSAQNSAEFVFNRAYFPGWKFFLDGKEAEVSIREGLPVVIIPPGRHTVTAYFGNTPIRIIGNLLSIITGIVLIVLVTRVYAKK